MTSPQKPTRPLAMRPVIDVSIALIVCVLLGTAIAMGSWVLVTLIDGERTTLQALPVQYAYRVSIKPSTGADVPSPDRLARELMASGRWTSVSLEDRDGEKIIEVRSDRWKPGLPEEIRSRDYSIGRITMGPVWAIEKLLRPSDLVLVAIQFISQAFAFTLMGLWLTRRISRPPPTAPTSLTKAILLGAGGGTIAFAISLVVEWLQALIGVPVSEQAIIEQVVAEPLGLLVVLPAALLLAPLGEELFFRGYVFRKLLAHTRPAVAYGCSAVLFAGIHFNPSAFLIYLIYGLALAYLLARTDRLLSAMAAHGVINALSLSLMLF
ncbi:MAG: type II CAAX endopeptidase family protein [Planctomycetota bacterium]|nr:type II CAAX endopeptidase family protein [Planctomycetota bacterium]